MASNISRNTWPTNQPKHYTKLLFTQRRPVADAEVNEMQDMLKFRTSEFVRTFATDGIVAGFELEEHPLDQTNQCLVKAGDMYVLSTVVTMEADFTLTGFTTPPVARHDCVYADIYYAEVDGTADTYLIDPIMGRELATREKTYLAFRILEGSDVPPAAPAGHTYIKLGIVHRDAGDSQINFPDIDMSGKDKAVLKWALPYAGPLDWVFVTETAPLSQSVYVHPGRYYIGQSMFDFPGGISAPVTMPLVDNQIAVVSVDALMNINITYGAEAPSPLPPALPVDEVSLAYLYLRPGSAFIKNDDDSVVSYITKDIRPFVSIGSINAFTGVAVEEDAVPVVASAQTFDFTGAGVSVTDMGGGVAQISIPGGSSGSVNTVTDGSTTVLSPAILAVTGSASVSEPVPGTALITVTGGGGGGSGMEFLPDTISDFYFDDTDTQSAVNVELWMIQPAVRFNSDSARVSWFNFEKNKLLGNSQHVAFDLWYALTSSAPVSSAVRLTLDYWIVNDGVIPNILVPTNSFSESVTVSSVPGNTPKFQVLSTLKVAKTDFATLGTAQRIVCRITRNITGAALPDYVGGAFDLISLVPKLV